MPKIHASVLIGMDLCNRDLQVSFATKTIRGPIKSIQVDDKMLIITLFWSLQRKHGEASWTSCDINAHSFKVDRMVKVTSSGMIICSRIGPEKKHHVVRIMQRGDNLECTA